MNKLPVCIFFDNFDFLQLSNKDEEQNSQIQIIYLSNFLLIF